MDYYLGIDGGGTKTKVIIIDEHEDVIYQTSVGPSSIDTVSNETTLKHLQDALTPFVAKNKVKPFKAVFAGLGGIVSRQDEAKVVSLIRQLPLIDDQTAVWAKNDMYNALYSSQNYDQAMALICGTGMVAFGVHPDKTHKAGGWGFEEGELGSAYHLGREAIRHVVRALDQRRPMDAFAKEVSNQLHLKSTDDIIGVTTQYFGQRTLTASLAPLVTKHANLGNHYAQAICDLATDELALAVKTVYHQLGFDKTTLVIVGSLGNAGGYFQKILHQKIKQMSADITITPPLIDPAYAAAKAAKHFYELNQET